MFRDFKAVQDLVSGFAVQRSGFGALKFGTRFRI